MTSPYEGEGGGKRERKKRKKRISRSAAYLFLLERAGGEPREKTNLEQKIRTGRPTILYPSLKELSPPIYTKPNPFLLL